MSTKRTPLLAIVVAVMLLILLSVSVGPVAERWSRLTRPSAPAIISDLASAELDRRTAAVAAATTYRPVSDELLIALMRVAREEPNQGLRDRAAAGIVSRARQHPLPRQVLRSLIEGLAPEDLEGPARLYAEALGLAAEHSPLPATAIDSLERLLADDIDDVLRGQAARALGAIGWRQDLPQSIAPRLAVLAELPTRGSYGVSLPYHAVTGLFLLGRQNALPDAVIEVLARLLAAADNRSVRIQTLQALATQSVHHPSVAATVAAALGDKDIKVSQAAMRALVDIEIAGGEELSGLLALAENPEKLASVRASAIARLRQKYLADNATKELILRLTGDAAHEVRAAAVAALPAVESEGRIDLRRVLAHIESAQADPNPTVRAAALQRLPWHGLPEQVWHARLLPAIGDVEPEVSLMAIRWITRYRIDTADIRAALADARTSGDERVQRQAAAAEATLDRHARSGWRRLRDLAADTSGYGGLLFAVLALVAMVTGLCFLVYFVARLVVYTSQRRYQALLALLVACIWGGLSYGLGIGFVVAAFGFGHNTLAPLSDQLLIDAVVAAAVALYAAIGWGLHYAVR